LAACFSAKKDANAGGVGVRRLYTASTSLFEKQTALATTTPRAVPRPHVAPFYPNELEDLPPADKIGNLLDENARAGCRRDSGST
jgi:hypothetical protein